MSLQNRIEQLEKKASQQHIEPGTMCTPFEWERSMDTLAEALEVSRSELGEALKDLRNDPTKQS